MKRKSDVVKLEEVKMIVKGQLEYKNLKQGKKLTRKQAILAKCYECNGEEESNADCTVMSCPLYSYHWHRAKK